MRLFCKPQLLVLLAAGASVELGVPPTSVPKGIILRAIRRVLDKPGSRQFHNTSAHDIDVLINRLNNRFGAAENWNFEHLLNALEVIENFHLGYHPLGRNRGRIMEQILTEHDPLLARCFDNSMFSYLSKEVFYKKLGLIFSRASRRAVSSPNWPLISNFLVKLKDRFEVWFGTLNYDSIVETALGWGASEEGFIRIGSEDFSEFSTDAKKIKLMHLHGSVNYGFRNGWVGDVTTVTNEICRYNSPLDAREHLISNIGHLTDTGYRVDVGPYITGFRKQARFVAEPYFTYYRHFTNLASEIPNLLVIGYGMADDHINHILFRVNQWHSLRRRVVFIDYINRNNYDHFRAWTQDKPREFMNLMRLWSEMAQPFDRNYPEPWMPTGATKKCLRVYMGGFSETIRNHSDEIFNYFGG
jgi:hypothetical protein